MADNKNQNVADGGANLRGTTANHSDTTKVQIKSDIAIEKLNKIREEYKEKQNLRGALY